MNHYDDLQRFKDKTRNQKLDFKDLSAQNLANDQGSWTIINQLSPATETSTLAMGGHVSVPVPHAVEPDLFAISAEEEAPLAVPDLRDVTPVPSASIFKDVASQLDAVAPAFNAAANIPEPDRYAPVMQMPAPRAASGGTSSEPASFARLFAPKAPEAEQTVEKNQPLQSLLERIASCR